MGSTCTSSLMVTINTLIIAQETLSLFPNPFLADHIEHQGSSDTIFLKKIIRSYPRIKL